MATGSGPFAGHANAALHAPDRELRAGVAFLGRVEGYHDGGRRLGLAVAGRLGRWHLGLAVVSGDFGEVATHLDGRRILATRLGAEGTWVLSMSVDSQVLAHAR